MRLARGLSPLFLCIALFFASVTLGALGQKVLSPDEKAELVSYLEVFMRGVHSPGLPGSFILRLSLEQAARTTLLFWGFGLAVIGAPLSCIMVLVRGFALGFGSSFVMREIPSGGLSMFFWGMLPHNILAVPSVVVMAAMSLSFSVSLVTERPWKHGSLLRMVGAFTGRLLVVSLGLFAASFIEAFVSPLLLARSLNF